MGLMIEMDSPRSKEFERVLIEKRDQFSKNTPWCESNCFKRRSPTLFILPTYLKVNNEQKSTPQREPSSKAPAPAFSAEARPLGHSRRTIRQGRRNARCAEARKDRKPPRSSAALSQQGCAPQAGQGLLGLEPCVESTRQKV
jgi:hypothetical protein